MSPEGEELRRLERRGVLEMQFGDEFGPGRLVLALMEESWEGESEMLAGLGLEPLPGWTTYVLDVEALELTTLGVGLVPLRGPNPRLYIAGGQAVIRFDPATGEHRTVLPALNRPRVPQNEVEGKL